MEFLKTIKEKWQTVLTITVLVAAIVFSISAFLTPQYGSKVSILVIQVQPNDKVDAFSAAKSAEYLSDILARVIYSESFVQNILESPYDVKIDFPLGANAKKDYWKKKIDVNRVNNTGIIEITVFDRDRANAEKIAESISWAYSVKGNEYHGGGDRVRIEKIDGPITSENPLKPNLLLNTLLGIILGLIGSVAVIYFLEDFELRIFGKKGTTKKESTDQTQVQNEIAIPSEGVLNFRKKHQDYTSFDEYVFDDKRKQAEEDAVVDNGKVEEEKIVFEDIPSGRMTGIKNELKREAEKIKEKVIEICEPNSIESELSFDEALVDGKKEKESATPVIKSEGTPGNLPIFNGNVDVLMKNGNGEAEAMKNETEIDKSANNSYDRESTEEEIKERLNKLLRGEM